MLQEEIHTIITSEGENKQKLQSLKSLFSSLSDVAFSDLDDTITTKKSMLYGRFFILSRLFLKDAGISLIAKHLEKYIEINPDFIALCREKSLSRIVVLSRNQFLFLEAILPRLNEKLQPHSIEIIGIVGRHSIYDGDFTFSSEDKLTVSPLGNFLISDMFEAHTLSRSFSFLSVDRNTSFFLRYLYTLYKYFHLLPYIASLCLFGKKCITR